MNGLIARHESHSDVKAALSPTYLLRLYKRAAAQFWGTISVNEMTAF